MINGKFFTGLPPKMIDKSASARNRQESHFFWPDDTKVEAAQGSRLKRRTSFQSFERNQEKLPVVLERQHSSNEDGVDTKERFHKEFAKSSIQFYDNLQDDEGGSKARNKNFFKITEKPTAMRLELPGDSDDGFASVKKKETFSSKIKFFDYIDEQPERELQQTRNNFRKMDVNDKREVEKNTKNSPKLQSKKELKGLMNGNRRDMLTPEREREQFLPKKRDLYDLASLTRSYDQGLDRFENNLPKQRFNSTRNLSNMRKPLSRNSFNDFEETEEFPSYRRNERNIPLHYERESEKRSFRAQSEGPKDSFLQRRRDLSHDCLEDDRDEKNISNQRGSYVRDSERRKPRHVHYEDENFD